MILPSRSFRASGFCRAQQRAGTRGMPDRANISARGLTGSILTAITRSPFDQKKARPALRRRRVGPFRFPRSRPPGRSRTQDDAALCTDPARAGAVPARRLPGPPRSTTWWSCRSIRRRIRAGCVSCSRPMRSTSCASGWTPPAGDSPTRSPSRSPGAACPNCRSTCAKACRPAPPRTHIGSAAVLSEPPAQSPRVTWMASDGRRPGTRTQLPLGVVLGTIHCA